MKTWQLQEAKAHLSAVVKQATTGHPQEITLRGEPAVVVISKKQYLKLVKPKLTFIDFMQNSPLCGLDIEITRNLTLTRNVDL